MKNKIFVLFLVSLLFLSRGNTIAQRTKLDSLVNANNKYIEEDSKKLELLNWLSDLYQWFQIDSGIIYADKAIAIAQQLNDQKGLATAYNNKAILLNNLVLLDEEEKILQNAISINTRINNTNGLADNFLNLSAIKQGDERKKLCEQALELFTKTNNQDGIARSYFNIGYYYYGNDFKRSLEYYKKSLAIMRRENNRTWTAYLYNSIGSAYMYLNDYQNQLYYANEGLKIGLADANLSVIGSCYTTIGNVYYIKSDNRMAIKNYIQGLRACEMMNSKMMQSALLNNIGGIYAGLKNYERALYYLNKGKDASSGIKDNLIYDYEMIGGVLQEQEKYNEAESNYLMAIKISIESKNTMLLVNSYLSLADLFVHMNDFDRAFYNLNKAVETGQIKNSIFNSVFYHLTYAKALKRSQEEILKKWKINPSLRNQSVIENLARSLAGSTEVESKAYQKEIFFELSSIYESTGKFDSAFFFYRKYDEINDTLLNTDNFNAFTNLQIQYETEKKEKQIALLSKDTKLQQTEIQKQKTQRNGLMGGCALVLLLAGITYNRYRVKQKANVEIEKTMEHLRNTQDKLIECEKLAHLGKLTADVAEEIDVPISKIKNINTANRELLDDLKNNHSTPQQTSELKNNLQQVHKFGREADAIIKKVLKETRRAAQ